jgi:hypothetical protein
VNKTLLTEILVVVAVAGMLLVQAVAAGSTGPIDPVVVPVSDALREQTFNTGSRPAAAAYMSVADALRESAVANKIAPAAYMSVADALRESEAANKIAPAAYVSVADALRGSEAASKVALAAKSAVSLSDSLREHAAGADAGVRTGTVWLSTSDALRTRAGN